MARRTHRYSLGEAAETGMVKRNSKEIYIVASSKVVSKGAIQICKPALASSSMNLSDAPDHA